MSFFKEIQPFMEYVNSIRKIENYLSFDLKFPLKWSFPKNLNDDGQMIPYDLQQENMKGLSFVTKIEESEISLCLTRILKIIKFNKEKEIKEKLFKETVDRLKTTFEKTELNKLQKLYFDFESDYTEETLDDEPNEQNIENPEVV